MNKINRLESSSLNTDFENENKKNNTKHEKVLCSHCGRTASNGIRCLGICVADSDY